MSSTSEPPENLVSAPKAFLGKFSEAARPGRKVIYYAGARFLIIFQQDRRGTGTWAQITLRDWAKLALVAVGALALVGGPVSSSYAANDAKIYVVQGLPGKNLDVSVDGKKVASGVETAAVAGPFEVKAG